MFVIQKLAATGLIGRQRQHQILKTRVVLEQFIQFHLKLSRKLARGVLLRCKRLQLRKET